MITCSVGVFCVKIFAPCTHRAARTYIAGGQPAVAGNSSLHKPLPVSLIKMHGKKAFFY